MLRLIQVVVAVPLFVLGSTSAALAAGDPHAVSSSTPVVLGYIDPTAGGLLIQVLLGGAAGVLILGRLFWGRIQSLPTDLLVSGQRLWTRIRSRGAYSHVEDGGATPDRSD